MAARDGSRSGRGGEAVMDFYEVLDQVIDLLRSRGRVSYRALQRQFHLDDSFIEDLKEELLYSHSVVDDQGRGLIWTGEADTKSASISTEPAQQEVAQEVQLTQAEPPPSTEPPTPDAERRQLTVMFCDLVDSTKLSSQLDPEDLRDVVREYQQVCSEVIQRYDGHVAQLLGDGLLVYFGYPQAHEDDAQRAVRAGLGIVEAIGKLNTHLEAAKGITLAVRLGIHTGLVVVGEMGGEGRQEQLALGEVPNVASRIQGIAEPDTIAISDATFHLVEGYFTCQNLGSHMFKGVADSARVYRVLQVRDSKIIMYPRRLVAGRYQQTIFPSQAGAEAALRPCSWPVSSTSRHFCRSSSPALLPAACLSRSSSAHRPKRSRSSREVPHSSGFPECPSSV